MSIAKLPYFYYPTQVLIVDDNVDFLEHLPANLSNRATYRLFDCPLQTMQYIEAQRKYLPMSAEFLVVSDDSAAGVAMNVDIPKIHQRIYDAQRFSLPSVVIVDHDMPGMTGIDFFRQIGDYPIKKIMLTGVADHKLAIRAFNDGIIHKFIMKDDPQVFQAIDQAITDLQAEYFAQLTDLIIKHITMGTLSFLEHKLFYDFFMEFCKEQDVCEFYLTAATGSFLMLTVTGELIWLVVQSTEEMENFQQAALEHDAAPEVIAALATREKLVCLFSEEDYRQSVTKWPDFLYPAQKAAMMDTCYYAVLKGEDAYKMTRVLADKFISYQVYRTSLKSEASV